MPERSKIFDMDETEKVSWRDSSNHRHRFLAEAKPDLKQFKIVLSQAIKSLDWEKVAIVIRPSYEDDGYSGAPEEKLSFNVRNYNFRDIKQFVE